MRNILLSLMIYFPVTVFASVSITGTRVIYNQSDSSITVKLNNRGDTSSVVQAWIDNKMNNQSPSAVISPFILYPAVFKIDSGGEQYLRIKAIEDVADSRNESLFWLNVKDVPAAPKKDGNNYLQLSIMNKIKLFYRPIALKNDVNDMYKDITWSFRSDKNGNVLATVTNASHYYASLTEIRINVAGKQKKIGVDMVAPEKNAEWLLKGITLSDVNNGKNEYGMVNDFGAVIYRPVAMK